MSLHQRITASLGTDKHTRAANNAANNTTLTPTFKPRKPPKPLDAANKTIHPIIMSPTYTMSAHLCKQIYSSWRQTKQSSPDLSPLPSPPTSIISAPYFSRPSSPAEKRSMDSDRGEPLTRQTSASNWRWTSR